MTEWQSATMGSASSRSLRCTDVPAPGASASSTEAGSVHEFLGTRATATNSSASSGDSDGL